MPPKRLEGQPAIEMLDNRTKQLGIAAKDLFLDLAGDINKTVPRKRVLRELTPQQIAENFPANRSTIQSAEDLKINKDHLDFVDSMLDTFIPRYKGVKTDPAKILAAYNAMPESEKNKNLTDFQFDFNEYKDALKHVANYNQHKENPEIKLLPPLITDKKIRDELKSGNFSNKTLLNYLDDRYEQTLNNSNKSFLENISTDHLPFNNFTDLKKSLGFDPAKDLTASELHKLEKFDAAEAKKYLHGTPWAGRPEEQKKAKDIYNHARAAQLLAFMEPREQAIKAGKPVQAHYPLEDMVDVTPSEYTGNWVAPQSEETLQGYDLQKEVARKQREAALGWEKEQNDFDERQSKKPPLSYLLDRDLSQLRHDSTDYARDLDNSEFVRSPTFKLFEKNAQDRFQHIKREADEQLEKSLETVRSRYNARGVRSAALPKMEQEMRVKHASDLRRQEQQILNDYQERGLQAVGAERNTASNRANLYRSAESEQNRSMLNAAQQRVATGSADESQDYYRMAQRLQRQGLPHAAALDEANRMMSIGAHKESNAQNVINAERNKLLEATQRPFNNAITAIQASQSVPVAGVLQNTHVPAAPQPWTNSQLTSNMIGTIANSFGRAAQNYNQHGMAPQYVVAPQPIGYAQGGHVQPQPTSRDLMSAYNHQLEAYEKASRRYQDQREDYTPTGMMAAGDAFMGIARQGRGGDPLVGFAEGMDRGQHKHDQYMNRGQQREAMGLQLEKDIAKGRGEAWKNMASHENELQRMEQDKAYKNAHLGLDRERLSDERSYRDAQLGLAKDKMALEYHRSANPSVKENAQLKKIKKATWKEAEATINFMAASSTLGAAREFLPSDKLTRFNNNEKGWLPSGKTIAGILGKGEAPLALMNMFDQGAANAGLYANVLFDSKNEHAQRMVERSKYNKENDAESTYSNAYSGGSTAGNALANIVENLRDQGHSEEMISRRINAMLKNADQKRKAEANAYVKVGKLTPEQRAKLEEGSNNIWNVGIKSYRQGEREDSNFNQESSPEDIHQEDEKEQISAPVNDASNNQQNEPKEPSWGEKALQYGKEGYDLANSTLAAGALGAAKGASSLVDIATYPIRKPISMALGEPVRGINERFVEPLEEARVEHENEQDRGTLGKALVKGADFAGGMLGGAGIGGGLIKGGRMIAPLAERGVKAFGRSLKEGNLKALPQYIGRTLGGESFLAAQAGKTQELKSLLSSGARVGIGSKLIEEGLGTSEMGSDLAAIVPELLYQGGRGSLMRKFSPDNKGLSKSRIETEQRLGEQMFPTEEALERGAETFSGFKEPSSGYTSTAAEALEGKPSGVHTWYKHILGLDEATKHRSHEALDFVKGSVNELSPSKDFLKKTGISNHPDASESLFEQALDKSIPKNASTTQETAERIRKNFSDNITQWWKVRKEKTASLYDKISEFEGAVPIKNSVKEMSELIKNAQGSDMRSDVRYFSDKIGFSPYEDLDPRTLERVFEKEVPSLTASKANEISKELRSRMDRAVNDQDWDRFRVLNNMRSSIDDDLIAVVPMAKAARDAYRQYSENLNNVTRDKSLKYIHKKKDNYHVRSEHETVTHFLEGQNSKENSRKLVENFGYDSDAAQSLRDHARNNLFDHAIKDGALNKASLDSWAKKNPGAFVIDKNLHQDIEALKGLHAYEGLIKETENLSPGTFIKYLNSNKRELSAVLSKADMEHVDSLGKMMRNKQRADQGAVKGESGTNTFKSQGEYVLKPNMFEKWKHNLVDIIAHKAASLFPGGGSIAKGLSKASGDAYSPKRAADVGAILNSPEDFNAFLSRYRARRIKESGKSSTTSKAALNALIRGSSNS